MRYSIQILTSHGKRCPYCNSIMRVSSGKKADRKPNFPTRDHVIPKSKIPGQGYLIVCRQCNSDKGNNTLKEWFLILKEQNDPRSDVVKDLMDSTKHLEL